MYLSICESTQIYSSIYQSIKVIQTIKSVYPNKHLFRTPVKIPSLPSWRLLHIQSIPNCARFCLSIFSPHPHFMSASACDRHWPLLKGQSFDAIDCDMGNYLWDPNLRAKVVYCTESLSLLKRHFLRDV